MALNIRPYAALIDQAPLLQLGRDMHAEAPHYRDKPFEDLKALAAIDNIFSQGSIFVAEYDGILVGMIGAIVSQHLFTSCKTAYAICHYVSKEKRGTSAGIRLVKIFEDWAFNKVNADEAVVCPSTGVNTEAITAMYKKLGYKMLSYSLVKARPAVHIND